MRKQLSEKKEGFDKVSAKGNKSKVPSLSARFNVNFIDDATLSERIDRVLLLAIEIADKPQEEADVIQRNWFDNLK